MNLLRRHLGPVEWADAFRRLAEIRGVALGGKGGRPSGNRDTVSQLAAELGVTPRTAQRRLRLSDKLAAHPEIVRLLDGGEIDAHRAEVLARERVFEERRQKASPPERTEFGNGIDVRLGRFEDVLSDVEDESVDLLLTDPPWQWDEATLSLWDTLGAFASRVLRPGGVLLAYSGSGCLSEAVLRLHPHLDFLWSGSLPLPGRHSEIHSVMARERVDPDPVLLEGPLRGPTLVHERRGFPRPREGRPSLAEAARERVLLPRAVLGAGRARLRPVPRRRDDGGSSQSARPSLYRLRYRPRSRRRHSGEARKDTARSDDRQTRK